MQETQNEEVQLETRERHEPSKPSCTQLTSACKQIPNVSSQTSTVWKARNGLPLTNRPESASAPTKMVNKSKIKALNSAENVQQLAIWHPLQLKYMCALLVNSALLSFQLCTKAMPC